MIPLISVNYSSPKGARYSTRLGTQQLACRSGVVHDGSCPTHVVWAEFTRQYKGL